MRITKRRFTNGPRCLDSLRRITPIHSSMSQGGVADFPIAFAQAVEWLAEATDTAMNLVVIDAAESSGCPSDGAQVNDWLAKVVTPWRKTHVDAGVSVLDHIPKTKDNRPDGPIGSQRKMAAVDVSPCWWADTAGARRRAGRMTLTNDKDRTGTYGKKQPVATIIGDWDGQGDSRSFGYRIVEPSKEDSAHNNLGGAILNAVDAAGPLGFTGKSKLQQAVGGNRNAVFTTIDNLVAGGLLIVGKAKGADLYTLTEEGQGYVD